VALNALLVLILGSSPADRDLMIVKSYPAGVPAGRRGRKDDDVVWDISMNGGYKKCPC